MDLSIDTFIEAERVLISVTGEVDVSCADLLRDAIDEALGYDVAAIEIDLSEVPYIDSTGIGVLVGAAARAAEAGQSFAVVNPQKNVARVLGLLGVERQLNIAERLMDEAKEE